MPGRRFLAKFGEDPGYVHERVCLWPLSSAIEGGPVASCVILTSGGDIYEEGVADYSGFQLLENDSATYPAGFVGENQVVQFSAPLEDVDLLGEIQAARKRAGATLKDRRPARPATQWMAWNGIQKDLPPLGRVDGAAGAAGAAAAIPRPLHDHAEDEGPAGDGARASGVDDVAKRPHADRVRDALGSIIEPRTFDGDGGLGFLGKSGPTPRP